MALELTQFFKKLKNVWKRKNRTELEKNYIFALFL